MSNENDCQLARVALPTPLARLTGGQRDLQVEPGPLLDVLKQLDQRFPMLRSQILKPSGEVRQFVGIFIDDEQIHDVAQVDVLIRQGSTVRIVLSVAGG